MSALVTVVLTWPRLFDAVEARFALDKTKVDMSFGWTTPQKHKTADARIVWVPGDDGNVGSIGPARHPGGSNQQAGQVDPRSLATLGELFTVHVSASDPQFPSNERSQYVASRLLFDAWYRAVYKAAYGTFAVQSLNWITDKAERRHGSAMVCVCELAAKIPDSPYTTVTDGEAAIVTSLEDVDETTVTT